MEISEEKNFVHRFFFGVLISVSVTAPVSALLFFLNVPYTEQTLLFDYHMQTLQSDPDIDTLIVGDSSAGNAISADLFSRLTGRNAANVALTASFGIDGSYNMVRHALRLNKSLKHVLIVESVRTWHVPSSEKADLITGRGLPCEMKDVCGNPLVILKYAFDPKEFVSFIDFLASGAPPLHLTDGYVAQRGHYARDPLVLEGEAPLEEPFDPRQVEALFRIDRLCGERGLTCVYVNGPLYGIIASRHTAAFNGVRAVLNDARHIKFVSSLLTLPAANVGDNYDHVSPEYKNDATVWFADVFTQAIR